MVELFSYYLTPHPMGFSAYFEPCSTGWIEERADECAVRVFSNEVGEHLLLVSWRTEAPAEVTLRQMEQMADAWKKLFAPEVQLPRDELVEFISAAELVSPGALGLADQNAGAAPTADAGREEPKRRRWFRG